MAGSRLAISDPRAYRAALYIRLSKEDESEGPSQSVQNQESLLRAFAGQQGLSVYDTYIEKSVIVGIKSRGLLRHKALLV